MPEAAGPGDGAGAEDAAAVRRLEEGELGAHPGILRAVDIGEGRGHLLGHQDIGLAMAFGGRQHQRMGRRAQAAVDDVELQPCRAAADETEIADLLLRPDALEDEGGAGIEAVRLADIVGGDVEALGHEADPCQRLGRTAVAPPEPAIFAGEGHEIFAGLPGPVAHPVLDAPKLDDAGKLGMEGDPPVEAVGPEIHEPAAAIEIGLHRVRHFGRVVFGMGPGDHRAVALQQRQPLRMQLFIGHHIEAMALGLEPGADMEIGAVLPGSRTGGADPARGMAGPHIEDGSQPRRDGDAAAVAMGLVEGIAVFAMGGEEEVFAPHGGHMAAGDLGQIAVVAQPLIGIGHVAGRRDQEQRIGRRLAARRQDEEGNPLDLVPILEPGGIEAAAQMARHLEDDIGLPAGIVEIVVVKMDRAVLSRRAPPIELGGIPVPALHRPGGKIDQPSVEAVGGPVANAIARHVQGEVPGPDQIGAIGGRRGLADGEPQQSGRQSAAIEAGAVDLAVEMRRGLGAGRSGIQAGGEGEGARGLAGRDLGDDLALRRALVAGIGLLRLLDQQDAAALRVEGGADEIPFPGEQGPAGRDLGMAAGAILEDQRQAAAGVEGKGEAAAARTAIDENLRAPGWRRRPDHGGERKSREAVQGRAIRHDGIGAGGDLLPPSRIIAGDAAGHHLLPEARALRVQIGADQANDLQMVVGMALAARLEGDLLAGRHGEAVGVTEDRTAHGRVRSYSISRVSPVSSCQRRLKMSHSACAGLR